MLDHGAPGAALLFALAPSDDTWARDHGPLTTLTAAGDPVLHDFTFNGWGGKFAAGRDNVITSGLHRAGVFGDTPLAVHPTVLEGGAIETDGQGTLIATRHSMIGPTRNPGLSAADLERELAVKLGLRRFLWLDHGAISGDDTDGHIDTLVRFADPGTLLYATAPPGDPDHAGLAAMERQLAEFRTAGGAPYRLLPLPFPGVHLDDDGRRLPATYANFLVINGAVLVPVYASPADEEALLTIGKAYPGRDIVPVDCRPIIAQNGSLHCLTMQFPLALPLRQPDPE